MGSDMSDYCSMFYGFKADKWQGALDWAKEHRPDLVFAQNGREAPYRAWESVYGSGTGDHKRALELARLYESSLLADKEIWNCR